MAKKRLYSLFLVFFVAVTNFTQIPESQLVFSWIGIEYGPEVNYSNLEKELLENRTKSFLLEIARQESYSLVAPKDSDQLRKAIVGGNQSFQNYLNASRRSPTQGYIMARITGKQAPSINLSLIDPSSGDVLASTSKTFQEFTELSDRLQDLSYELFGLPSPNGKLANSLTNTQNAGGRLSQVNIPDILGTWKGDFDIVEVQIRADGTGIAKLQNGESLRLRVKIEDLTVTCTQDEPNSPKLYLGSFPLPIANQIVKVARPMSWTFSLSVDKTQLFGKKLTSHFTIERGQIIQTDNTYSRDAVWIRIP